MRYFYKELVQTPLYLPNGNRFPFDNVGNNEGVWATDDPFLISEAENAMRSAKGGVSEIPQDLYDDLIKKKVASPSLNGLRPSPMLNPAPRLAFHHQDLSVTGGPVVAVVTAEKTEKPDPVTVPEPKSFKRPKTGRP